MCVCVTVTKTRRTEKEIKRARSREEANAATYKLLHPSPFSPASNVSLDIMAMAVSVCIVYLCAISLLWLQRISKVTGEYPMAES